MVFNLDKTDRVLYIICSCTKPNSDATMHKQTILGTPMLQNVSNINSFFEKCYDFKLMYRSTPSSNKIKYCIAPVSKQLLPQPTICNNTINGL